MTTTLSTTLARSLAAVSLLAVASVSAAASPASDFKKAAKAAVKSAGDSSKAGLKQLQADLKAAAAGYAASTLDAASAVADAVDAVTAERDAVADAAETAVADLASAGASILRDASVAEPGADFAAGGRGAWDGAVRAIEGVLDANDAAVASAFAKFVSDMAKGAGKRDAAIDIRFRVPAHDETFRTTEPPSIAATRVNELASPQVTIGVRLIETSQVESLDLGIRFGGPTVDVSGASGAAGFQPLGTVDLGPGGTATGHFGLAGVENPANPLALRLDAATLESTEVLLSTPRLVAGLPAVNAIGAAFGTSIKTSGKKFSADASDALSQLSRQLSSHVAAVGKGFASADVAVRTGFGNLHDARSTLARSFGNVVDGPLGAARTALIDGGFGQTDLTAAFAPDAASPYGAASLALSAAHARSDAAATKQFASFLSKIGGLAQRKDEAIGFGAVFGNTPNFLPPILTLDTAAPAQPLTDVQITDAVVIRVRPDVGPDTFTAHLLTQVELAAPFTFSTAVVTVPVGDSTVLGGVADSGGIGRSEIPLLGDVPVLGWLFRSKSTESEKTSLVILVKPTIFNSGE